MSKPPKIVIPGLNRGAGIPGGYVLGRRRGTKQGPAELLNLTQVRAIGIATTTDVTTSTSLVQSIAHSETISLSRSVSTSLSALSGSVSGAVSSVTSLSTAVSSGLSSTNSTNVTQSTSLSQISSSVSGAISSTASLSGAVSTSLAAKANLAGGNIFTGNQTVTGDVLASGDLTAGSTGADGSKIEVTNTSGYSGRLTFNGPSAQLQFMCVKDGVGYSQFNVRGLPVILQHDSTDVLTTSSAGVAIAGSVDATTAIKISSTQVVGARKTGWSVDTGTSKRTANATYAAGATLTFSNPPTAAEMSALATRLSAVEASLQDYTQTAKAMKDDLHSTAGHGLIGT